MWKTVKLGDVCERVSVGHVGITTKHYCESGIPFVRTQNVTADGLNLSDLRYITNEFHKTLNKSKLKAGDVLLSRVVIDEMRCAIVPPNIGEANCANVILVRPKKELSAEYFSYLIKSPFFQEYLMGKRKGAAQQVVNTGVLKHLELPLPPLAEQQRIVEKLDRAFEEIDRAIEATERKKNDVETLKRAVLKQELGAGAGSNTVMLGEVCEFRQGIQVGKEFQKENRENKADVRFLRIIDFTQANEPPRYIDFPGEKYLVQKNDISLVRYGNPGFVCRGLEGVIANNLFRVIPKTPNIHNDFLYWFLMSPFFQEKIGASKKGVAMQAISFGTIKDIEIHLPSLAKQQRIVEKLYQVFTSTDEIARAIDEELNSYKSLKSAILAQELKGPE